MLSLILIKLNEEKAIYEFCSDPKKLDFLFRAT